MAVQVSRRRFSVDEYYLMAKAGILHEDDRVELIEGEIVDMAAISSKHQACVDRTAQLFFQRADGRAIVRVQGPIRLSEYSEPQPDIALLRPRADFYAASHPGPPDVLLVIEVSLTSEEYDRQVKIPLYARAGIPEVWLVDLEGGSIEVYREPSSEGYRLVRTVRGDERLAPESLPGLELTARDILGS